MTFVVGLTGGIGSGKTAVSDRFKKLGITIADADMAARVVVELGTDGLNKITAHFGERVLQADGTLDRAALRQIVFNDSDERRFLESITVPAILKHLRHTLDTSTSRYAILMLSSGSGQSPWIDRQLVVDVSKEMQISRVMSRDDNQREQVLAIMKTQPTREQRLDYADDVITNNGSINELDAEVARLHNRYLELSQ
ncbi:MAG: dephospho-CoA kinase [Pseudomonadales bacterium]|nr:dephospho-CoA kinase [Pseudomonadales bacterium]MDG1444388.1 dephospho-CoA kinase [Pseudomonadales bacterium]